MSNKNYDDINIPEDLDVAIENGALKAKNEIRKKINKKYSIIAASIAGFITLGIISQPVLAEQIPALGKIYETMGFKSVENSLYIGESIVENGVKITLENIACVKNKALFSYKIEADKEILDKYNEHLPISIMPRAINSKSMNGTGREIRISDTEILYFYEYTSDKYFESNGKIQIEIFSEELKIKKLVKLDVDFNELIRNSHEISLKLNESDELITLQITPIGSLMTYKNYLLGNRNLLKVGNKIYPSSSGGSTTDSSGTVNTVSYNSLLTYNVNEINELCLLKDNIYELNMYERKIDGEDLTNEEIMTKIIEESKLSEKEKDSIEKSYINGVSYPKGLIFENGNKAEMLNCEKRDGKIYFDVKGTRDSEAWALANGVYVTDINNKYNTQLRPNCFEIIDGGYRVEFDDILEGDVKLVVDPFTEKYYDRKITEELKLNIK